MKKLKSATMAVILSIGLSLTNCTCEDRSIESALDDTFEELAQLNKNVENNTMAFKNVLVSDLREELGKFRESKSPREKFLAASLLRFDLARMQQLDKVLPEWLRNGQEEVNRYLNQLLSLARQFESSLKPKEIDYITQANPEAPERILGKLSLAKIPGSQKCPDYEVERLREKLGDEDLKEIGPQLVMLNTAYRDLYRKKYMANIANLIDTSPEYKKYKILPETIYSGRQIDLLKHIPSFSPIAHARSLRSRITSSEKQIRLKVRPQQSVKKYVAQLS